jgi:type III pantothenate kinase
VKLIIDIGNTLQKTAVFDRDGLVFFETHTGVNTDILQKVFGQFPINVAILSSVINHPDSLEKLIREHCSLLVFNHQTPIPIKNNYLTPETLGKDRLASVVAAQSLFPNQNVLVIDAGTCFKFDLLNSQGEYIGGAISPGIHMRFLALHTFTGKLPLINVSEFDQLIGKSTEESILSGVINGSVTEIDGIIDKYKEKYPDIVVVFSGGDADYLANKLKNKIFAIQNIVLTGLKLILDYNENQ